MCRPKKSCHVVPEEGRASGCAIAQAASRRLGFDPRSGHVEFVVDKMELRFPLPILIPPMLHTHHHLSSGADTVGQTVASVPHLKKLKKVGSHTGLNWQSYTVH
jgi:hypothetical protein